MKHLVAPLILAFGFTSNGLAQMGQAPEFVLSGESAYGLIAADPIAGGVAQSISWSDSGRYVAVTRFDLGTKVSLELLIARRVQEPPPTEQTVVVYDVEKRKGTVVWRSMVSQAQMITFRWLKNSDSLAGVVMRHMPSADAQNQAQAIRSEIVLMSAVAGNSRTILSEDQAEYDLKFSPVGSIALIGQSSYIAPQARSADQPTPGHWESRYRVLGADGRVSAALDVPGGGFFLNWSTDGVSPIFASIQREGDSVKKQVRILNLTTGQSEAVTGEPKIYQEPKGSDKIATGSAGGTLTILKTSRGVKPAWLTSADGETQALVAADVSEVALSPKLNAVAYISEGAAMVRAIIQVPKDFYLQARGAAERNRIMSNAKQVGLALIMYASDMDDTLPGSQADIGALVDPYLKNPSLMAGFVYSFGGGLMTDVKEPANTEMGYIPGPGGKAIVYIDGHVKWVPDK